MTSTVPPGLNLSDNRAPQLYTAQITIYVLAVVAVTLRLIAKKVSNSSFWFDDWFLLTAFIFTTAVFTIIMLWLDSGLGRHIEVVVTANPAAPITFLKELLAGEFCYTLSLMFTKFSILSFYWRIFGISKSIRLPLYIITGIVTAWSLSVVVSSSLSCIPIAALWDVTIQGRCIDLVRFYIGITIPNVITDLALLILPLPYIWRLHVATSQKALIAGAFIVGGLTCVISIVRLAFIVSLDISDLTYGTTNLAMYTGLETYCAIICTCLPSLGPLLHLLVDKSVSRVSKSGRQTSLNSSKNFRSFRSGKNQYSGTTNANTGSFTHLNDEPRDQLQWGPATSTHVAYGAKKSEAKSGLELRDLAVDRINVTTDVAWHHGAASKDI